MGFFTRLIAGLVAASTLGAGLAGTAGAVDTTGTTGDAKDVVKLASADTSGLPDHLVNGDFQTYGNQIINLRASGSRYLTLVDGQGNVMKDGASHPWTKFNGWNATNFAWESNDSYGTHSSLVELQRSEKSPTPTSAGNVWGEIAAATEGKYIYQDIATTPGVMYKWSLKHASRRANSDDTMQVKIGDPGKTVAQQATRTTSNGSDKTGSVGTAITTHGTAQDGKWETYSGTYIATSTVTRFTFKSLRGSQNGDGVFANAEGNCIDDVMFTKAYKLSYDKNASDATGKVPSDETAGTVRQTKARTTGTVHLASDDKNGLPDHLVNGDFEYPGANVLSKNRYDEKDANWWGVSRKDKMVYDPFHETQWVSLPSTFDSDKFAWDSTEVAGVQNGSSQWHTNEVELQRDSRTGNMYAELCAYQAQTSIRQYIHTTPGTLYKVRLKHASLSRDYLDKMQVLIGPAGNEQPVRMTRVESRNGLDATGESTASTTVSTHASNEMEIKDGQGTPYSSRNHDGQWATYEGVYVATSDVTSFTFKSVDAKAYNLGNLLDDIVFDKAYRLSYDKNATDANGSVPSDETAGATKQAKSKTNGSVRLAADDDVAEYAANGLPEQIVNGGFDYPSVPSWTGLVESSSNKFNKGKLFATINPGTGKYGLGCAMSTTGRAIPNWNRLNFAWNSTQGDTHYSGGMSCEAGNVELNYDSVHHNQFAELTADQQGTAIYQDVKVTPGTMMKWSLKHSSATSAYVDKMQVLIGEPYKETAQEATRITSENGNKVGERMTTISTPTTSDRADNKKWDTYSGTYLVPDGVTTVRFTFKSVASAEWYSGNDLDDIEFSRSYKLTYDKNSSDAAGSVPSDMAANTTRPAKSETDGKVSDLVQRTTTHEDGSVTVRTVDQSTDVVSGCQVYYPAGQRITLATLAKDGDCWDSSMLTRPGHTQLGWSQDSQATQAQAEVTMVEGGMTVYAVWVGNPVLTYDTNKPNTWNGQMPSTPASVSVAYNTAAADGSGWQSGDTSKIRGYRFLGWYAGPQDDSGLYDWNTLLTGNVTVYAHWQRLQANVVYDANGGTGSHGTTTGWQYSDVTVPSDTSKSFTRAGYVFLGWDTQADGNGTAYKDGSQVPLQDKDITLYAQWQPVFEQFTPTGGVSLPLLVAGGVTLLVMGIGSTVMLTRRMRGEQ